MNIQFDPKLFVDTIVNAATGTGLIQDSGIDLADQRNINNIIVIAAAPKSGSTFLASVLSRITALPCFRLCSAYSTNEHDLYLPALLMINKTGCVSQMHMKGTFHNASLMQSFGIKPVILVRNIYDIVASLHNDLRNKEQMDDYGTGCNGYSFIWQDEATRNLDDDELLNLIIDLIIPWYINFYVSWYRLCIQGQARGLWVTYEDMMGDKKGTINRILGFTGIDLAGQLDERILQTRYKTFNRGTSGRGELLISDKQKIRIKRLFSYYKDVDFSLYGNL